MIPILRQSTGLTVIGELTDCISCKVTERLNDSYEMTMQYPLGGQYEGSIAFDSIIECKPNAGQGGQYFRVYSISKHHSRIITIKGYHVSYELGFVPCTMISGDEGSPSTIFQQIKNDIDGKMEDRFLLSTAQAGTIKDYCYIGQTAMSIIKDVQSKVGGEFLFDNYAVFLQDKRGGDKKYSIEYGKNITSFQLDYENAGMYQYLLPYAAYTVKDPTTKKDIRKVLKIGDSGLVMIKQLCTIAYANECAYTKALAVDLTGYFKDGEDFNEGTLLEHAKEYMSEGKNQEAVRDTLNVSVSHINLGDTVQYPDLKSENIDGCGDIITVTFAPYSVSEKCEVVATTFDSLTEMYDSIELSTSKKSIVNIMRDVNSGLADRQAQNSVWKNVQNSKSNGLEFVCVGGDENDS